MKLSGMVCIECIYVYLVLVFNFDAYARVRVRLRNIFRIILL